MQKRFIGTTGIAVSVMGLGTVKFGRTGGVRYPTPFYLPTDHEIGVLLGQAAEIGINLLDTAPAYGDSEEKIGRALKGTRQQWVLSTKVGEEYHNGQSYFDFSSKTILKSIERSLRNLGTDYLDIVLVHSNGEDRTIITQEKVFETLSYCKKNGLIRAYGMSTKTVDGGLLTITAADLAMVTFNVAASEEREVIAYAHKCQKGIFIKKALLSGHVCCAPHEEDPVQRAMELMATEPGITSVIIGTLNVKHLQYNAACLLKALASCSAEFL